MAAVDILPLDLTPFAPDLDQVKAQAMIEDALALAARVAPCIKSDDFEYPEAAKAILRGAILRWYEAGSGGTVQQSAGPFGQTTQTNRRGMFWPSEIEQLQDLCRGPEVSGAFTVDTIGGCGTGNHSDACSLVFGATYCSCGAVINGGAGPLYGV